MSEPRSVEELWQALDGLTGEPRAETLLELAERLRERGELGQCLSLVDAACAEADAVQAYPLQAEARMTRGRVMFALDDFVGSAAAHTEAARLAAENLDTERHGRALVLAGDSLSASDDPAAAAAPFAAAESILRDNGSIVDAGSAAFYLGRVLWRLDENAEALEALDRARECFRAVHDAAQVVETDDLRASVLLDLDRPWDAVEVLRSTLYVTQSLDANNVSYAQWRLGVALRIAGKPDEALPLLEQAAAGYREDSNVAATGQCLLEQARCRWDLEEPEPAFQALAQARAHLDADGRDDIVITCDVLRAAWLHGIGDYAAAAQVNERLTRVGDEKISAWARWRLADNHYTAGDPASALAVVQAWPDVPVDDGNLELARIALTARVLLANGHTDDAWTTAAQGLQNSSEEADARYRAWLYDVRAQIGRGDASADRAHAIALHLATGAVGRARELSQHFLPSSTRSSAGDDTMHTSDG